MRGVIIYIRAQAKRKRITTPFAFLFILMRSYWLQLHELQYLHSLLALELFIT